MSRHVSDQLSAYIDGDLGVRDVERVKAHLDVCPTCLQEFRDIQDVQRLLRGLPDPAPRPGFFERMHWTLGRKIARHPRPSLASRWLGGVHLRPVRFALAASALALVLGLPWAWRSGQFGWRGEAPLDTDAYVRHYLALSSDRSLVDEATTTFVSSDPSAADQPTP